MFVDDMEHFDTVCIFVVLYMIFYRDFYFSITVHFYLLMIIIIRLVMITVSVEAYHDDTHLDMNFYLSCLEYRYQHSGQLQMLQEIKLKSLIVP